MVIKYTPIFGGIPVDCLDRSTFLESYLIFTMLYSPLGCFLLASIAAMIFGIVGWGVRPMAEYRSLPYQPSRFRVLSTGYSPSFFFEGTVCRCATMLT